MYIQQNVEIFWKKIAAARKEICKNDERSWEEFGIDADN
jgi:hypothetical protein